VRKLILLYLTILAQPASLRAGGEIDLDALVARLDRLYRSRSSHARVVMEIVTPHWERELKMEVWTEGMEKTLIRISSPKKERGVATLRIGREMWNYLPRVNKVIKIPPSMMMSSWMGSDFTNDDLAKETSLQDDYVYRLHPDCRPDQDTLVIVFTPKENTPIVWGRIEGGVLRREVIPLWEKFFDERGNLVRILRFSEVRNFGGRRVPSMMEMTPLKKEGHRTTIRYLEMQFDVPLAEGTFSLRNLRKR